MIGSGLDFSFSGLKTAVLTLVKNEKPEPADVARAFVDAIVEVLVAKCARALEAAGLTRLVVAGGVGANVQLRAALDAECGAARLRRVLSGAGALHRQRGDDCLRRRTALGNHPVRTPSPSSRAGP